MTKSKILLPLSGIRMTPFDKLRVTGKAGMTNSRYVIMLFKKQLAKVS